MKHLSMSFIAAILLSYSVHLYAANVPITNPKQPIQVASKKPQFTIKLKSNPSTGYSWFINHYDAQLVTLVSHAYQPPTNAKLVGAPGVEVWTFKINRRAFLAPHMFNIQFVYARPWDLTDKMTTYVTVVTSNH